MGHWTENMEIHLRYLHAHVLAVAVVNPGREWAVYVADAAGGDAEAEYRDVVDRGAKLPQPVAEALWPELADRCHYRI